MTADGNIGRMQRNVSSVGSVYRGMKRILFAFAVLVLAVPAASAQSDTEHLTQTVKLHPGGTLRLRNFSGRTTISATEGTDVVIDAIRRAPRERLNRIKLDVHSE